VAVIGPALLATLAFAVTVGLGYADTPVGWQGWLESLFAVGFVASGGAALLHGASKRDG
jgi:hypothetical protein